MYQGMQSRCQGMTKSGSKFKRSTNCRWHTLETCPICFDEIHVRDLHFTTCKHTYHKDCITKWFESSDECPVCRNEQSNDPMIVFKRNIKTIMEETYMDAIRSLEQEIVRMRQRRVRRNVNNI